MRTLFLQMMVSLDGYIGGPNGEIDWHNFDDETAEYVEEMFRSIDEMVFGRKTFDIMAAHWPTATGPSAKPMNELPKVVFSRSPKTTTWSNARVGGPSVRREIEAMKKAPGKDIVLGGADLAATLIELGLLDEMRLIINPVVLGKGQPLFARPDLRPKLTLLRTRTFKNGNVLLVYRPEPDLSITTARTIAAPREKVFEAWTNPALLAKWWGPKGFTNTFETHEPRAGGDWRFVMHGPDGKDYRNESRYVEVTPPERIVFDHLNGPHYHATATFEAVGEQTRLTWNMRFATTAEFEAVRKFAVQGNEENLDKLEAVLGLSRAR